MFRVSLLVTICLLFSGFAYGQSEKWEETGDEAMQGGFYYSALQNYKKALRTKKEDEQLLYKSAEAARLYNNYKEATSFYEQIIQLQKENLFPDLYFHLGTVFRYVDSTENALEAYQKYLSAENKNKKYLIETEQAIASCHWAMEHAIPDSNISVQHLSNKINSKNSEWGAVMIEKDVMLFSSLREYSEVDLSGGLSNEIALSEIYQSRFKNNNNYSLAIPAEWLNNSKYHTSNACLDKKNNRIYFTRCGISDNYLELQHCQIYCKDLNKRNAKPKKLCAEINHPQYTATQPTIAYINGETILFFVSNRPGGFGGMDIWYSAIQDDGQCAAPKNLGNTINTPGDEITPFYDQENHLLYFSSDYHYGYGGFDIFAAKDSLLHFGKLQNVGKPINSSANDTYFTINTFSGKQSGFFTSNREGSFYIDNSTCCNDIYNWSVIEKRISSKDSLAQDSLFGKPKPKTDTIFLVQEYKSKIDSMLPIKLYFDNDQPDPRTKKLTTEFAYNQLVDNYLEEQELYIKEYSKNLTGKEKQEAIQSMQDFFQNSVKHNYDKLQIFTDLLLKDLEHGMQIRLEVRGYASPLHTSEYNEILSKRRISSLINQLLQAENASLSKYLNKEGQGKGSLEIIELALGSSTASGEVSSNPHDLQNSVYSINAVQERRVEIQRYTYDVKPDETKSESIIPDENNKLLKSVLELERNFFLIGEIPAKKGVKLTIPTYNSSDKPQTIEVLEAGCRCAKAFSTKTIQPKENGEILVEIDASKEKAGTYVLVPLTIKVASEDFSQTIFIEYQISN